MAEFLPSGDPPPSPQIENPVKTIGDESSPTTLIQALVSDSLLLSSVIPQIHNQSSPPAKSLTQIQNPDESSYSPIEKEENECRDSQIMPSAQISPDNTNNKILQIASTAYSPDAYGDSFNSPPSRYMQNFDYQSDDDPNMEPTKSVELFSWLKNPTGVGAGLDNSGNTCFIASVLQCFTHTVPLLDSLLSYKYQDPCNCGNDNFCVLQALRDHIALALWSSGYDISIDEFRDNLNYFSPDFQINNQEDAHEFLQSFLEKLQRCCLEDGSRNMLGSVCSEDVNIVDHIFGGRLVSKLRCCNCNSFSETFEPSLGWSLEIEDVEDLSNALESFTCVEKLEDQLTCDDCEEKVSKEKQLKFDKLPTIATFHLKRFKNNGVYIKKIFKDVKFPLVLDLLPYMSSNENPEVSTKYHLYAMVEHLGNGVYCGHYTSYVRSAPETWHHFNDAMVTRISQENVLSKNAYMLFYAREGTPCFSSVFEEMKTLFEANSINFSPTSVLETTNREECVSDHSCQNLCNSNKACNGSVGVSIPGGACSDDESWNPFAETSYQEEPTLYPAGNRATIDPSVTQVSSPKRKASERAIIGEEAYLPRPNIQKPTSFPKPQETFQIQREHLQNKKKKEETR